MNKILHLKKEGRERQRRRRAETRATLALTQARQNVSVAAWKTEADILKTFTGAVPKIILRVNLRSFKNKLQETLVMNPGVLL